MIYWHIQMYKPSGRNVNLILIDSSLMLKENPPLIGTGEWPDDQCYKFKGTGHDPLEIGAIILVREGAKPLALCRVTGNNFQDDALEAKYHHENYRSVEILEWYHGSESFPQPQQTLQRLINPKTDSWQFINRWYQAYKTNKKMQDKVDLLLFKNQIILQGPPGTGKTFTAKDIAEKMIFGDLQEKKNQQQRLLDSGQFKIIQFHPAYAYEDFVRGITIKPAGATVTYEAENKTLVEIAGKALENWRLNHAPTEASLREQWLKETISEFKNYLIDALDNEDEKLMITKRAYISRVTDGSIRYNADGWPIDGGVPVNDLRKMYLAGLTTRKAIMNLESLSKTARSLPTYWLKVLELFKKYIATNKLEPPAAGDLPAPKNFVLIIDEINRANLPAVLGECIYALEYRGERVESMYEYEGDKGIILPPNLYIIGTMNTADRSVGHIDYAIRRRFAFISVPPSPQIIKDLLTDPVKSSALSLFEKVKVLFEKDNLASDFKAEDVQPGHSYFLADSLDKLRLKLDYEVKPLLREYLKDGVILPEVNIGEQTMDTEQYIAQIS